MDRSVAREAVGALERELVTSTQRAAGESGACEEVCEEVFRSSRVKKQRFL